jgi:molybdopterin-binding protein
MAEYTAIALQEVDAGQNIIFTETPVRCNRGYVLHREGSGIFTLRGITNQCTARYKVSFGGNIAVPAGGTVGEISVAIAIEGEPLASATAIVTPAAVEEFFNVFTAVFVEVPRGCCLTVSVENTSADAINVQNANLIVERVA